MNRTVLRPFKPQICTSLSNPESVKFEPAYRLRQDRVTNT